MRTNRGAKHASKSLSVIAAGLKKVFFPSDKDGLELSEHSLTHDNNDNTIKLDESNCNLDWILSNEKCSIYFIEYAFPVALDLSLTIELNLLM